MDATASNATSSSLTDANSSLGGLKNSHDNAHPPSSTNSRHSPVNSSTNNLISSSHKNDHKGASGDTLDGARESFQLYQPYSGLFSGSGSTNSGGAGGPERCHTASPVGMHHQQRLMSPTSSSSSPYFSASSSRLMKSPRDSSHSMLQKRPSSADGGATEAKRSPKMFVRSSGHGARDRDRDRDRHRSPPASEHTEEDEADEEVPCDGDEDGSDLRMEDGEGEEQTERHRDSKRSIKLLPNNSREEDRPRSRHQHLESGKKVACSFSSGRVLKDSLGLHRKQQPPDADGEPRKWEHCKDRNRQIDNVNIGQQHGDLECSSCGRTIYVCAATDAASATGKKKRRREELLVGGNKIIYFPCSR